MFWIVFKTEEIEFHYRDSNGGYRYTIYRTSFHDSNFTTLSETYTPNLYSIVQSKLKITAENTNYASVLLSIKAENTIKAKLKIRTEIRVNCKLQIKTINSNQALLRIVTLRLLSLVQSRLKIATENSNYASALLRIQTTAYEPAKAKLHIRVKGYSHASSPLTLGYYEYYGILF